MKLDTVSVLNKRTGAWNGSVLNANQSVTHISSASVRDQNGRQPIRPPPSEGLWATVGSLYAMACRAWQ
eukprot:scaffold21159_cov31-Prasinocladus_malaysianus.AAC.1